MQAQNGVDRIPPLLSRTSLLGQTYDYATDRRGLCAGEGGGRKQPGLGKTISKAGNCSPTAATTASATSRPPKRTQVMREKIDLPESRRLYGKRMGIVEPVLGNIRHNKGVNRFWHRGKEKVNLVWTLHCLVHNLGKLVVNAPGYITKLAGQTAAEA